MLSQRRLAILNYVIGIYAAACFLLDYSSLRDVKELIEVNNWHGCWRYRDFSTYVSVDFSVFSVLGAAFLVSWLLLRSAYWRLAHFVVGFAVVIAVTDVYLAWDCVP